MTPDTLAPAPEPAREEVSRTAMDFGTALQGLVADFWTEAVERGKAETEADTAAALQFLFSELAHELGRLDGVARLHGIGRDQMLPLLAKSFAAGKQACLLTHHQEATGCTCEASTLLRQELDFS